MSPPTQGKAKVRKMKPVKGFNSQPPGFYLPKPGDETICPICWNDGHHPKQCVNGIIVAHCKDQSYLPPELGDWIETVHKRKFDHNDRGLQKYFDPDLVVKVKESVSKGTKFPKKFGDAPSDEMGQQAQQRFMSFADKKARKRKSKQDGSDGGASVAASESSSSATDHTATDDLFDSPDGDDDEPVDYLQTLLDE